MLYDAVKSALLGHAVGDALGVPVEFRSRQSLENDRVTGMRAYGTHGQPAGSWSDDAALSLCLAETLCDGLDLKALAGRFVSWKAFGYWSPHGEVFDIGIATAAAIDRLQRGVEPVRAGGDDEGSNGNGSLMRILPLAFPLQGQPIERRFEAVRDVSSLTHRHPRSVIACFLCIEYALALLAGHDPHAAFAALRETAAPFLQAHPECPTAELARFGRILGDPARPDAAPLLPQLAADRISSSGYVLSTLEASLWCLLNTRTYRDAVLLAVNLGEDTDTTGAVTGGLAGLWYGWNAIPGDWLAVLARRDDLDALRLAVARNGIAA